MPRKKSKTKKTIVAVQSGGRGGGQTKQDNMRDKKVEAVDKKINVEMKLFDKWDSNVEVKDPGLKRYISLIPRLVPK
jgi:hypothetical protein